MSHSPTPSLSYDVSEVAGLDRARHGGYSHYLAWRNWVAGKQGYFMCKNVL